MYLIDTNVLSESRKGALANAGVQAFRRQVAQEHLFIAVQTVGEIRCGVERIRQRGNVAQAARLEKWLALVVGEYADRILVFDTECAEVWGGLMARGPQHPVDRQLAAIALIHDLTVVTRNVADFEGCGLTLINPFH